MPTTAEVLALIGAMPARYQLTLVLAGLGGLRMDEVLGLRLADVDTLRSAVHIRQTAQEVPKLRRGVKDPKSHAGRRTVVLPRQAMEAIVGHVEVFGCAAAGELVTDPRGGPATARRARVSAGWPQVKAPVGVDPAMHPHDLCHHAASPGALPRASREATVSGTRGICAGSETARRSGSRSDKVP